MRNFDNRFGERGVGLEITGRQCEVVAALDIWGGSVPCN